MLYQILDLDDLVIREWLYKDLNVLNFPSNWELAQTGACMAGMPWALSKLKVILCCWVSSVFLNFWWINRIYRMHFNLGKTQFLVVRNQACLLRPPVPASHYDYIANDTSGTEVVNRMWTNYKQSDNTNNGS